MSMQKSHRWSESKVTKTVRHRTHVAYWVLFPTCSDTNAFFRLFVFHLDVHAAISSSKRIESQIGGEQPNTYCISRALLPTYTDTIDFSTHVAYLGSWSRHILTRLIFHWLFLLTLFSRYQAWDVEIKGKESTHTQERCLPSGDDQTGKKNGPNALQRRSLKEMQLKNISGSVCKLTWITQNLGRIDVSWNVQLRKKQQ